MATILGPRYLTLRLLCANAVGMVAFLAAFVFAQEFAIALGVGLLVEAVGFVTSRAVVDFATAGDEDGDA